jgi:hypothetical protein
MRLAVSAAVLTVLAVAGLVTNFLGAAAGHCDEHGCSGNFPRWLYIGSGWFVLACVVGLLAIAAMAVAHRIRRR